jgi:ABC-type transport system substrate-binding protein
VKYSFERAIIIADPDGPAWMLDVIRGAGDLMYDKIQAGTATQTDVDAWRATNPIEVVDTYTVKINLNAPYAPFLSVLAYSCCAIVSPSWVEAHGGITIGEHNADMDRYAVAGTGPYTMESWDPGVVTLVKYDDYWGGPTGNLNARVQRVILKTIPDANTRLTDLLSGNTDFAAIVRDHWYQVINQTLWVQQHQVVSIVGNIRAVGPLPTFSIDFLGFNQHY